MAKIKAKEANDHPIPHGTTRPLLARDMITHSHTLLQAPRGNGQIGMTTMHGISKVGTLGKAAEDGGDDHEIRLRDLNSHHSLHLISQQFSTGVSSVYTLALLTEWLLSSSQ